MKFLSLNQNKATVRIQDILGVMKAKAQLNYALVIALPNSSITLVYDGDKDRMDQDFDLLTRTLKQQENNHD